MWVYFIEFVLQCDLKDRQVEVNEIESAYKKENFIGWTETSAKVLFSVTFLHFFVVRRNLPYKTGLGTIEPVVLNLF